MASKLRYYVVPNLGSPFQPVVEDFLRPDKNERFGKDQAIDLARLGKAISINNQPFPATTDPEQFKRTINKTFANTLSKELRDAFFARFHQQGYLGPLAMLFQWLIDQQQYLILEQHQINIAATDQGALVIDYKFDLFPPIYNTKQDKENTEYTRRRKKNELKSTERFASLSLQLKLSKPAKGAFKCEYQPIELSLVNPGKHAEQHKQLADIIYANGGGISVQTQPLQLQPTLEQAFYQLPITLQSQVQAQLAKEEKLSVIPQPQVQAPLVPEVEQPAIPQPQVQAPRVPEAKQPVPPQAQIQAQLATQWYDIGSLRDDGVQPQLESKDPDPQPQWLLQLRANLAKQGKVLICTTESVMLQNQPELFEYRVKIFDIIATQNIQKIKYYAHHLGQAMQPPYTKTAHENANPGLYQPIALMTSISQPSVSSSAQVSIAMDPAAAFNGAKRCRQLLIHFSNPLSALRKARFSVWAWLWRAVRWLFRLTQPSPLGHPLPKAPQAPHKPHAAALFTEGTKTNPQQHALKHPAIEEKKGSLRVLGSSSHAETPPDPSPAPRSADTRPHPHYPRPDDH